MSRFQSGTNIEILSQVSQKCFYYSETDHLFLFCPIKTEDKKKDISLLINSQFYLQTGANTPVAKSIDKEIYKKIYASVDNSYDIRRPRT